MDERDSRARQTIRSVVKMVSFGLMVTALVRELRTPSEDRTWHGRIGVVPYDLRPPTPSRIRDSWWNPDDARLLTPRAFGVGWAVNLGAVWARLTG